MHHEHEPTGVTMKKILILGTGCPKCKQLYENTEAAIKASGVEASIEKVEKITDIIGYGVMTTPALVVDDKIVSAGKTLTSEQIIPLIQ
jgi:small redox-active disulfide protein 2